MIIVKFLNKSMLGTMFFYSILAILSFGIFLKNGLNLSLEFEGGIEIVLHTEKDLLSSDLKSILNIPEAKISMTEERHFLIRLPHQDLSSDFDFKTHFIGELQKSGISSSIPSMSYIGGEFSQETTSEGIWALSGVLAGLLAYISFRFQWRLAIGAVLALLFDPALILGCFSYYQWSFDLATLAGLLSVMGYSINDTIVVFDRFRENLKKMDGSSRDIFYLSLEQTFHRTMMTSILTSFVIISLLIFQIDVLEGFARSFGLGIIAGTISSIVIAGPCALLLGISKEHLFIQEDQTIFDPREDRQFKKYRSSDDD